VSAPQQSSNQAHREEHCHAIVSTSVAGSTALLLSSFLPQSVVAQQQATTPDASQEVSVGQARGELILKVPEGYKIEKVVHGLSVPTSLAWDGEGNMYVAEAGGQLYPEESQPMRIFRVDSGKATEVIDLSGRALMTAVVGLTYYPSP
jgi:hypothetical protein